MGSLTRWYVPGLAVSGVLVAWLILFPYRTPDLPEPGQTNLLNPMLVDDTSDIWDYLQLGRNLYHGHGFTSYFTYVPFLPESVGGYSPSVHTPQFPLLWRQPGYPVMMAVAFVVAGDAKPNAALWLNGLAIVLLPIATYFLGRVLLTPGWAALAGLLTLLSPAAIGMPSPLVATTWFAVLVVLLVLLIFKSRQPMGWVAIGLLLGLLALVRLETWILAPGLLFLFARLNPGQRVFPVIVIVGVACLVVLPWQLRLMSITGSPFYNASSLIYHGTETFPGWDSSRTLAIRELTPLGFIMSHTREIVAKTGLNLARFLRDLVLLPSPLLAPVLWLAFLKGRRTELASAYLWAGLIMVSLVILVLAPMEYSARFLAPLIPLLSVGAVLGMSQLPRFHRLLALSATVVGLILLGGSVTGRGEDGNSGRVASDLRGVLVSSISGDVEDPVTLADAPTLYAWISERHAVWAPVDGIHEVRALLPRSVALFTRDGGPDRTREELVIKNYLESGGTISAPKPPFVITWPLEPDSAGTKP